MMAQSFVLYKSESRLKMDLGTCDSTWFAYCGHIFISEQSEQTAARFSFQFAGELPLAWRGKERI